MLVNGNRHVRRGAEGKLPGEKEAQRGGQKAEVGEGEPWNSQRKQKAHTAPGGRVKVHWVGVPLT